MEARTKGRGSWLPLLTPCWRTGSCPDDATIAYVRFMPNADHAMKAFGEAPLERVHILTMVLCPDGLWRAWGLSENYFPTAAEVKPGV